jgi:hypothetical protein
VPLRLGCERVERLAGRLVPTVVVDGRVPQRPIEPGDDGLFFAAVDSAHAAHEGLLQNVLRDCPAADPSLEEGEEVAVFGHEDRRDLRGRILHCGRRLGRLLVVAHCPES